MRFRPCQLRLAEPTDEYDSALEDSLRESAWVSDQIFNPRVAEETRKLAHEVRSDITGELLGGLIVYPHGPTTVSVGYWTVRRFRGLGVASSALDIALKAIRAQGEVTQVIATCAEGNTPSVQILKNKGFSPSGTFVMRGGIMEEVYTLPI